MGRMMLIARREFLAYAKTFGFWLSLLSLPLFGGIAGGVVYMMRNAEPVPTIATVEEGEAAAGLVTLVSDYQASEQERRRLASLASAAVMEGGQDGMNRVRDAAENQGFEAGLAELRRVAPNAAQKWTEPRPQLQLAPAPPDVLSAAPGVARDEAARKYLNQTEDEGRTLDAIILLSRGEDGPQAKVWTAKATDETTEDFAREALRYANRVERLSQAGVAPDILIQTNRFRPEIKTYSPRSVSGGEVSMRDRLPMFIGFASGFLLWSLILTGASILLNSVMEEKSNKILEVLLSSASATEVLTGKVLGVALVTLTMLAGWAILGAGGLIAFGRSDIGADILSAMMQGGLIFYFVLFMIGGYLMYAVLFAAIGAFCETPRDAQTLMGPIMMVLMVPLIVMQLALRTPDAPVVKIMSWIPPFTPFLMSVRAPSEPPMLEILATVVGMFVFAALMVWLAGRAFRAGALTDVKLSWKSFGAAIRGAGR